MPSERRRSRYVTTTRVVQWREDQVWVDYADGYGGGEWLTQRMEQVGPSTTTHEYQEGEPDDG